MYFGELKPYDYYHYSGSDYMVLPIALAFHSPGKLLSNENEYMYNVWNVTKNYFGCFQPSTSISDSKCVREERTATFAKIQKTFECICRKFVAHLPRGIHKYPLYREIIDYTSHMKYPNVVHIITSLREGYRNVDTTFLVYETLECVVDMPFNHKYAPEKLHKHINVRGTRTGRISFATPPEEVNSFNPGFNISNAPQQEKQNMSIPRQSHMLALMQDNMTTVSVSFPDGGKSQSYTYKCTLEQAANMKERIKKDGLCHVIVPQGINGFKIAIAKSVDDTAQIDLDANYAYKWIVGVVEYNEYNETIKREMAAHELMRQAERNKQKLSLMESFGMELGNPKLAEQLRLVLDGKEIPPQVDDKDVVSEQKDNT